MLNLDQQLSNNTTSFIKCGTTLTAANDGGFERGHISISVYDQLLAGQRSEGQIARWVFSLLADCENEHRALSDLMLVEEDRRQTFHGSNLFTTVIIFFTSLDLMIIIIIKNLWLLQGHSVRFKQAVSFVFVCFLAISFDIMSGLIMFLTQQSKSCL